MTDRTLPCPGCAVPMRRMALSRKLGGDLAIDLCAVCRLIWFDQFENLQLSAGGLLELFKQINEHVAGPGNTIPERLDCPRCKAPLRLTHDLQRSTRFVYYRCERDRGKLSAFHQFLREKNFVRSLSPAEVDRLKVEVKQVRCSGCGAPINLQTDSACPFCKAPIDVLDANAMRDALSGILAEERQHRSVQNGLATVEGMIAALESSASERRRGGLLEDIQAAALGDPPDLLNVGIGLVAKGYTPGR